MNYLSKKRFTMRQVVGLLTIVFLGIAVIAYAAVTIPNTFSNGQPISSGQVNQNFATLGNAMPAVKTASNAYTVPYTNTSVASVASITVTPPVNGYIILTGTTSIGIVQGVIANNYVNIYLATTPTGTDYYGYFRGPASNTLLDNHFVPVSMTAVFPVAGGTPTTFYMNAERDNSGWNNIFICYSAVDSCRLTALFVPTALP